MQGWRVKFFSLAASVACSFLVACGGGGGGAVESGAQSTLQDEDAPAAREVGQGLPPAGTGAGSLRDFTLQVGGVRRNAPVTISTSDELRLVPDATGALASVVYWGDGKSVAINGGWNASTAASLMSHRYTAPGRYQIEYATRDPNQGWDGRVLQITVVSGTSPPAPTPSPTPSAVWRPFNASSPWNTPIGANPALQADSQALINAFRNSSPFGEHLDVNIAGYSIPLYQASASTPLQNVAVGLGGQGWGGGGLGAVGSMPIPAGATPDPASDAHMAVLSADRTKEYGCFDMNFNRTRAGAWYAALCATSDLTGSGVRPPATTANPWWAAHGARACGFPLVAGLIRADEIRAGRIDHALVFAYPGLRRNRFTPPASTNSSTGAEYGIPCGGRIQFDPSIDVTKLGLSPAGVTIMRALQQYGAYVGDYSGALSMYADNSPAARAYWNSGVLGTYELRDKIDLSKFRVIKYNTVYAWPPGS
jgi:hypothetical protein